MDFSLTEEQEMLRTSARDFLENECSEAVVRETIRRQEGYSPDIYRKIAGLGWLGLIFPEQYGGAGMSLLDLAVLYEEMGRAMYISPHLSSVVLSGLTILDAGTDAQKQELLPRIASGDLVVSPALAEPESSWDGTAWEPGGVSVKATADSGDYVIDGIKLFVHDAHVADYVLCVARTREGGADGDGVTLFLVDAKSPGITCTPLKTMSGNHKQSEVVLDKVRVPASNIIGELHGGWAPLARAMQTGNVMLCAEMTGAGQKILEITVDYAKTRMQFDMPIGIQQFVQEHCVQLVADVDTSRWLTYLAAWKLSEGQPADFDVAVAKAWTSEHNERACWRSHQVFAGVASTEALGVMPLYTRFGNVSQYYLGGVEHHLKTIADELESLPPPERPTGKPLGLWDVEKQWMPSWDTWRAWYESIA
jgi:alkylation response protein AidB-like acyl-CoA dehydrogenase